MVRGPASPRPVKLIELQLETLDQLFDPLDPFPTPSRDLAKGAEEFIVSWARDLPQRCDIALRFYLPSLEARVSDTDALKLAIESHFTYRANRCRGDLKELVTIGQISLVIGLGVLAGCILLREIVRSLLAPGAFSGFLAESLVIVGWVANWRPIDVFLYDWWPIERRRRLFLKLAAAPVEIASRTVDADQGRVIAS